MNSSLFSNSDSDSNKKETRTTAIVDLDHSFAVVDTSGEMATLPKIEHHQSTLLAENEKTLWTSRPTNKSDTDDGREQENGVTDTTNKEKPSSQQQVQKNDFQSSATEKNKVNKEEENGEKTLPTNSVVSQETTTNKGVEVNINNTNDHSNIEKNSGQKETVQPKKPFVEDEASSSLVF